MLDFNVQSKIDERTFRKEHCGLSVEEYTEAKSLGETAVQYKTDKRINEAERGGHIYWFSSNEVTSVAEYENIIRSVQDNFYRFLTWFTKLFGYSPTVEHPRLECLTCGNEDKNLIERVGVLYSEHEVLCVVRCRLCGKLMLADFDDGCYDPPNAKALGFRASQTRAAPTPPHVFV